MSAEPADLTARLKALEAASGKASGRPKALLPLVLGGAGLLVGGGLLWALSGAPAEPPLQTAAPEEFQTLGSGFGNLPPPVAVEPREVVPAGPTPAEEELRKSLAALQSELATLKSRPVVTESPQSGDPETLSALSAQLAQMEATARAAEEALERQLTERDRELERLRIDLELSKLGDTGSDSRAPRGSAPKDRITSPLIAWTGSDAGSKSPAEDRRLSGTEAFVREGAAAAPVSRAAVIVNPAHTVLQGTVIQAVLESAMDSSQPGVLRAVVSEDVHALDGSRVLIPRGAQLLGRYKSDVGLAEARVTVAWDRILLPDHQSVTLSAYGGDELGRAGVSGHIDSRFGKRFGSAALISLIGAVPDVARAGMESERAGDVAGDVAGDLRDASRSVMQDYLTLRPVIRVPQGSRITVMVDRDLEIL